MRSRAAASASGEPSATISSGVLAQAWGMVTRNTLWGSRWRRSKISRSLWNSS